MRLKVIYHYNIHKFGVVWYKITPAKENQNDISDIEKAKLKRLQPRISRMASRVLGGDFIRVECVGDVLTLGINKHVASGAKKTDFRSLCGWIELCDEEIFLRSVK